MNIERRTLSEHRSVSTAFTSVEVHKYVSCPEFICNSLIYDDFTYLLIVHYSM